MLLILTTYHYVVNGNNGLAVARPPLADPIHSITLLGTYEPSGHALARSPSRGTQEAYDGRARGMREVSTELDDFGGHVLLWLLQRHIDIVHAAAFSRCDIASGEAQLHARELPKLVLAYDRLLPCIFAPIEESLPSSRRF